MLFSSPIFIFLFLPLTVVTYYLLRRWTNSRVAIFSLLVASLIYYGWWNEKYLILIMGSVLWNYSIGLWISSDRRFGKALLAIGVASNLALLGYYKYVDFFILNINAAFGLVISDQNIVLPLAISFFTFQQIAYLVDSYSGIARERNFLNYCLFVTFFPQLVAGPIVHHKEMLPQFTDPGANKSVHEDLSVGLSIFAIGLFKKIVLADNLAVIANPVFDASLTAELTLLEAWCGTMAYTMQLYFDFSGYSDMAIGLARLFGIRLPANFNSPYKSRNIIDFWRRWHMTLSRFLRDYLYIPLGGSRKGTIRRYVNLAVTMLLGGLWHGAGWTFVAWGLLHGIYLAVNNVWITLSRRFNLRIPFARALGTGLTFLVVVIAWVFFRATSFESAFAMLQTMFGFGGTISLSLSTELFSMKEALPLIVITTMIAWYGPNTQQIMANYRPTFDFYGSPDRYRYPIVEWRPSLVAALAVAGIFAISVFFLFTLEYVEFIYWSF